MEQPRIITDKPRRSLFQEVVAFALMAGAAFLLASVRY